MRAHVLSLLSIKLVLTSARLHAPPTLPSTLLAGAGIIPAGTLSHFCIVTSWDGFNATLATYGAFLGVTPPVPGIAGGADSNGTYLGKALLGTTKIAFMQLNNETKMEFLAGDPAEPSWWRDVYMRRGYEVHHMGYVLPLSAGQVWSTVTAFAAAGLGEAVQWGRWGVIDTAGAGCYVYMASEASLGVTVEILANGAACDSLPAQPSSSRIA